ncbi:Gamma-secretase subunit pen-2 [Halotydeus destructor]|nr:Gamma-secretase subunit pen-2 [Halotydeus destructor]
MDLRKSSDSDKLDLCRKYFLVGLACLPFLWAVNFFWFFNDAFRRSQFTEQSQLKLFTVLSGLGALAWIIGLTAWNVYFQTNRASLSWGDDWSFIIPIGRP